MYEFAGKVRPHARRWDDDLHVSEGERTPTFGVALLREDVDVGNGAFPVVGGGSGAVGIPLRAFEGVRLPLVDVEPTLALVLRHVEKILTRGIGVGGEDEIGGPVEIDAAMRAHVCPVGVWVEVCV